MATFRAVLQMKESSIERLRRITPQDIAVGEVVLWVGPEAVRGTLDLEVNGRHVFEISPEGFRKLRDLSYLGTEEPVSRVALNSACLVDWVFRLLEAANALVAGASRHTFDLAEHGFQFRFVRANQSTLLTVSGGDAPSRHYLGPWMVNRISDEVVPIDMVVQEAAANGKLLLRETNSINPVLASHPEVKEIASQLSQLRATAGS